MKVFISWSGERGKMIGEAFKSWLPDVIQSVEPFYSPDIEKGQRWSGQIEQNLKESKIGIICVTPESMLSPWLMFEAGAISNAQLSKVCPLLFQLDASQLRGPLNQFQATPFSKEEVKKLVDSINAYSEPQLGESQLTRTFERLWPDLQESVDQALKVETPAEKPKKRSIEEMLEETLTTVRSLSLNKPEEDSINHWIVAFRGLLDFGHKIAEIGESESKQQTVDMIATTINHLRLMLNLAQPKISRASKYKELQAEAKTVLEKLDKAREWSEIPF